MDVGAATIIGAAISAAGTAGAVMLGRLRRENSEQHAEGRELIRAIGENVLDVKADVRDVKADVREVKGRVSRLESGTAGPIQ